MSEHMRAEHLGTKFSLIIAKDPYFEKAFIGLSPPLTSSPTLLLFVTENSVLKKAPSKVKKWKKHQPSAVST